MANELHGLVLAGGESRRMGRDKALLQHGGKSQLAYMMSLLEPLVTRAFVSLRDSQSAETERRQYAQIADRYSGIGPIAGILSAMDAWPAVDWLVVACDLPNVSAKTLQDLLACSEVGKPFTAYRSSHDGLPEPLCALYRAGSDKLIRGFVDEGIVCPRKIMIRSNTLLLDPSDPEALDNINTPDDLARSRLEEMA